MASGYMKALYKDCKENKMTLHFYNSTVYGKRNFVLK